MGSSSSCINEGKGPQGTQASPCPKRHARPRKVSQLSQVAEGNSEARVHNSAESSCNESKNANANTVQMVVLDLKPTTQSAPTAPSIPPSEPQTNEVQHSTEQGEAVKGSEAMISAQKTSSNLLFDDVVPPLGRGAAEGQGEVTNFQPIVSVQIEGTNSTGAKFNSESYTSSAMLYSPFASLARGDAFEHVPNPLGYRVAQQAEGLLGVHHVAGMVTVLNPKVVASQHISADACQSQSSSSKRDGEHSSGSHTLRSGNNNAMMRRASSDGIAGDSAAPSTSANGHLALFAPSPLYLSRMPSAEQQNINDGTSAVSEGQQGHGTTPGKFLPLRKAAPEGSSTLCKADVNAMLAMDAEEGGIGVSDASGVYPDAPNTFKRPLAPALSQTFQDGTHRLIPVSYNRYQKRSEESSASFSGFHSTSQI